MEKFEDMYSELPENERETHESGLERGVDDTETEEEQDEKDGLFRNDVEGWGEGDDNDLERFRDIGRRPVDPYED